ncbi:primosomal replication protein [Psychromonas antarctica]|jgi:primosomal protein N''|uniref:primosomal replication protein n=1 Tax=Psychromonas antarctica TaxID=67573 RepID=UPI001EE89BB5|nr:primosomal replication protein [Psychromonas antarctica]MCG6201242.1 primosomal replication protein [Psychromonas antarctica]
MAELSIKELNAYRQFLTQLKSQLDDLDRRCIKLDGEVKQSENHCFVFEVHLFTKRSYSLVGYIKQIQKTFDLLQDAINKQLPEPLIKYECELFVGQFHVLLQLVQGLEKGEADLLYKSYSSLKEQIYQQLQKQYRYEQRLLTMISEQEERLASNESAEKSYIKEKIAALKIRYQKCNSFTQKLEFQLEEIQDE